MSDADSCRQPFIPINGFMPWSRGPETHTLTLDHIINCLDHRNKNTDRNSPIGGLRARFTCLCCQSVPLPMVRARRINITYLVSGFTCPIHKNWQIRMLFLHAFWVCQFFSDLLEISFSVLMPLWYSIGFLGTCVQFQICQTDLLEHSNGGETKMENRSDRITLLGAENMDLIWRSYRHRWALSKVLNQPRAADCL